MKATRVRFTVVAFALSLAMLAYIQRVAISQAAAEGSLPTELALDKAQMGWVFGAFALSYALLEVPMGALGDKFGVRRVLAPLVLIWSAFTAFTGAAWNFTSLVAIRFIFGAGEAGCFPNLTKMLSVWLPRTERIRAQALMWACTRWAGAATPPLAYLVIDSVGWRWGFVFFGALGALWVALYWVFYKDDPATHKKINAAELDLLQGSRTMAAETSGSWLTALARWDVLLLVIQYSAFSYVWFFYVTWLPTYLREYWDLTTAQAAGFAVMPLLFGGFGALLSGAIPARIPRRTIALFGFVATALLLFAVTRTTSAPAAMILMALASFCSDLTMPISWNACVDIGRRFTATVAATMNMASGLAGFSLSVLGGTILARLGGDWNMVLYTMVAAATLSAVCWLFLNPDKQASGAEEARRAWAPSDGPAASLGEAI